MTDVIINGAKGRMGSILASMAWENPDIHLAGVCERPGRTEGMEMYGCLVGDDLGQVMAQLPRAVVVDFTAPEASTMAAGLAKKHGNALVIGTTGLDAGQQAALEDAAKKAPIFWAPNMSVGINVLLKILPALVKALGPAYDMEMFEAHHNKKKDAPSGTAIKLAQCLAEARGWDYDAVKNYSREGIIGARPKEEIGVQTIRGGDVVGEHTMFFFGPGERVEVTHRAHSRETFAAGALRAARWLVDQEPCRLYGMQDMF